MIDAYGSAFDQHSVDYAQTWGEDPIARLMRDEVFCSMKTGLNRPSKVLDLGCGIGLDSAWLVSQGHSVLAVDHSAGMLAQAQQRVPELSVVHARAEDALDTFEVDAFDAAILNFGGSSLDLTRLAAGLTRCIRPGGLVWVVPMPRIAPLWVMGALKRGRFGDAWRRFQSETEIDVGGVIVTTRYLTSRQIVDAMRPGFHLQIQRSLGLSIPPPGSRTGASLGAARIELERRLSSLPLLRQMGDHLLMRFQRETRPQSNRSVKQRIQRKIETRRARETGTTALRTPILELTEGCQSHCVGCSHRGPAGGESLDLDRIQALLSEARALGAEEVLLTGGEPLIRSDIVFILEAAHASGLRVTLLTNGLALKKFAAVVSRCCDTVVVSLDAVDEALYRRTRGVDGLRLVSQGIRAVRKLAPQLPIEGRCTVTHHNVDSLQQIALQALAWGMAGLSYLAADQESSAAFGRDGSVPSSFGY